MTLLIQLEAPLMSFGAPMTSGIGPTYEMPTQSMLTGLLGNALGLCHWEGDRLERLQESFEYVALRVDPGHSLEDYQTVDVTQDFMQGAWTMTRGVVKRGGGKKETMIRNRFYWASAAFRVAVCFVDGSEFDESQVARALQRPARPLFIGRKPCLPSCPIFVAVTNASVWDAVRQAHPRWDTSALKATAWGPLDGAPANHVVETVRDLRAWNHGVHLGARQIARAELSLEASP